MLKEGRGKATGRKVEKSRTYHVPAIALEVLSTLSHVIIPGILALVSQFLSEKTLRLRELK